MPTPMLQELIRWVERKKMGRMVVRTKQRNKQSSHRKLNKKHRRRWMGTNIE
jgi:hypothetical protein